MHFVVPIHPAQDLAVNHILSHGKRHSAEVGRDEATPFLPFLALDVRVAVSTQNQALGAISPYSPKTEPLSRAGQSTGSRCRDDPGASQPRGREREDGLQAPPEPEPGSGPHRLPAGQHSMPPGGLVELPRPAQWRWDTVRSSGISSAGSAASLKASGRLYSSAYL